MSEAKILTECTATVEGHKLAPIQLAAIIAMFHACGYEFTQSESDHKGYFNIKAVRQ